VFSRTHRFIIKQNKICCTIAALTMLVIVVLSLFGQPWTPWAWWFKSAPTEYWDGYMPLAQFTAASTLAYLALDVFRHSNAVSREVRTFFGPTAQDREGVVKSIQDITMGQMDANRQLIIFIFLWELGELRRFWGRGQDVSERAAFVAEAKAVEKTMKAKIDDAEMHNWFWKGTGRAYIRHFLKGMDTVLVTFGLVLSVWLHALSALENAIPLFVPPFFLHWTFKVSVISALMAFGVVLPLYYVFIGRKLMDEISDISDKAFEQFNARKKELSNSDKGDVKSMLDDLREQIRAATDSIGPDTAHEPSIGPKSLP
jgi:hypothetical protein